MVLIEPTILHVPIVFLLIHIYYIHKQAYYFINLQIWDLDPYSLIETF